MRKTSIHFPKAQEGWGQLRHCAGFIGQIGEPCEAGILSVWKNLHCYQRFMQHQHDEIFAKSEQGSTYTNICVDIFEGISNIGTTDSTAFLNKGLLLRVADCSVKKDKHARFEQMLKTQGTGGCCQAHSVKGKTADIWPHHYGTMKVHINGIRIRNCLH